MFATSTVLIDVCDLDFQDVQKMRPRGTMPMRHKNRHAGHMQRQLMALWFSFEQFSTA
jgi:hypothetical protein